MLPQIPRSDPSPVAVARGVIITLILGFVAACAGPGADSDRQEKLAVLGLDDSTSTSAIIGPWEVEGVDALDKGLVTVVSKDGVPTLRIANGTDHFALVRPTRSLLAVTPYLSWAWNIEAQGPGPHPVRLIVGFGGGRPPPRGRKGGRADAPEWMGVPLPFHDRVLVITWGDSALQRGSLIRAGGKSDAVPAYTTRGGRENAGSWWLETVDLAALYARAWPGDDVSATKVTFVGVAAAAAPPKAVAHVSGIILSR